MLHLEAAPAFMNAALAQNKDLLSAAEGIDDAGPFFESGCHLRSVEHAWPVCKKENN